MSKEQTTFDRTDLLPHWLPSQPESERAALRAAWQALRSCADCRWWEVDAPGDVVGGCGAPGLLGGMLAPADWTCEQWEAANVAR